MGWRFSLCAMVLVVSACAGQGAETTDPPEQATTTSMPTTEAAAPDTTTTTVAATTTTVDEWEAVRPWRGGPAGEYRMAVFEPTFKFTTTSSFLPTIECSEMTTIVKSLADGLYGFWFYKTIHSTVDEAWAHFDSQEALSLGEPEEVSVGGAPGVRASVEVVGNWITGGCGDSIQIPRGSDQTIYIVDVAGRPVTVFIDEIPGVSDEKVQALIDSIEWRDISQS